MNRIQIHVIILSTVLCLACNSREGGAKSGTIKSEAKTEKNSLKTPRERLDELIGTWNVVENSFVINEEKLQGRMIGSPAADGHALYTSYKQGSGNTYYEANALWGFSETSKQVRVFEVNSLGFADTHVGYFDSTDCLILELRDPHTNDLLQKRVMNWDNDTLHMNALFISNGVKSENQLTLARQRD